MHTAQAEEQPGQAKGECRDRVECEERQAQHVEQDGDSNWLAMLFETLTVASGQALLSSAADWRSNWPERRAADLRNASTMSRPRVRVIFASTG